MDPTTIIMLVVVVAALYFLMIRPQQKRAKQQKEHMAALQPGARVMTVHGIFGTLVHLGDKQAIIEVSPGVELTVLKQAISNQPVQDEFEYEDEPGESEPAEVEGAIDFSVPDDASSLTPSDPEDAATPPEPAEPLAPAEPADSPEPAKPADDAPAQWDDPDPKN